MDMGGDNSNACKISVRTSHPALSSYLSLTAITQMLWNWYTINSCFISRGWHVRNAAAFAATCIVIFALVILLEFTRRAVKEYDCYVVDRWKRKAEDDEEANLAVLPEVSMEKMDSPLLDPNKAGRKFPFEANAARRSDWKERYRPTVLEQTIRSLLHTAQFTIAYFVML